MTEIEASTLRILNTKGHTSRKRAVLLRARSADYHINGDMYCADFIGGDKNITYLPMFNRGHPANQLRLPG